MAGGRRASPPNRGALRSFPGETPRIPPPPRRPRAGHRDRSTASIDHRHRKIPPAFASNHLRSIRHYGIRMESERPRIGEGLRSIHLIIAREGAFDASVTDDGACDHLPGLKMPSLVLPSTAGRLVDLSKR